MMRPLTILRYSLPVLMLALFPAFAAADIIGDFNNMNGGQGYLFWADVNNTFRGSKGGEIRLRNNGTDTPSLSGYKIDTNGTANNGSGSNFYFQSFCVDPLKHFDSLEDMSGTLNRNGQTLARTKVTVGVAFLYKQFASGNLNGYNYAYGTNRANSAVLLQDAIWFLMGQGNGMDYSGEMTVGTTNWSNNIFLQYLSTTDSTRDWLAVYNMNDNYNGLMDDYKVLVMNTVFLDPDYNPLSRNPLPYRQDVLYVVRDGGGGNGVPEPASILLWTLGSLGAAGMAYRKRRNNK